MPNGFESVLKSIIAELESLLGLKFFLSKQIFYYLQPAPQNASYYREAFPYGPQSDGTFRDGIGIDIDPAYADLYAQPVAVISGLARFIPDQKSNVGALVITPDSVTHENACKALGNVGSLAFVYRNLDSNSVRDMALPTIRQMGDAPFATSDTPENRANGFIAGEFAIPVVAGGLLGKVVKTFESNGWPRLQFEIAMLSRGVAWTQEGIDDLIQKARITELIDPASNTRRYDPSAFFASVAAGKTNLTIDPSHQNHPLTTLVTRRSLIEIRDEYDDPYHGGVNVTKMDGTNIATSLLVGSRGTIVAETLPPISVAAGSTYIVGVGASAITELPTGTSGNLGTLAKELLPPAHWVLQAITMSDLPAYESNLWFADNLEHLLRTGTNPRFWNGNKVTPIRDGIDLFSRYAQEIRAITGTSPSDYTYLAGWAALDDFPLMVDCRTGDTDSASNLQDLLQNAATKTPLPVQVRVLLNGNSGSDLYDAFPFNTKTVRNVNKLKMSNAQAIYDVPIIGPNPSTLARAHHQKLLVVGKNNVAVAYCGGIDINTNRRDTPNHGAFGAFHDVHAKLEGPAVSEVQWHFVQRWNNHTSNPPSLATAPPGTDSNAGSCFVQVAATYGAGSQSWCPNGVFGPLAAVRRAIQRAKKFIYIEDQYLTPYAGSQPDNPTDDDLGVLKDLRDALTGVGRDKPIDYLIIVIPNYCDQPQNRFRRHQFIASLQAAAPDKVYVFYLGRIWDNASMLPCEVATEGGCDGECSGSPKNKDRQNEIYIHSKVWMVDDICFKIGSANCNHRSYTFDSELDLVVIDGAVEDGARSLARAFRRDLWGEHLNLSAPDNDVLSDHKVALSYWLQPPEGARIRPYQHAGDTAVDKSDIWKVFMAGMLADPAVAALIAPALLPGAEDVFWNKFVDPDGRSP